MAYPYPFAALISTSGPRKTTILPIRPIMPIDSEFAITLPFEASKVSQELRAAIIKRRKDRWAWFSRAESLDEERGTQLGTLGYLPWEIRQKIFGELFDRGYHQVSWPPSENRRPKIFSTPETPQAWQLDEYPHSSKLWMIRTASASLMFEVEFAFITTMNLDFTSIEAIMYFLGRLTTCKNSALRSITVPLILDNEITAARKAWINVCAGLPTGHNSVEFGLYLNSLKFWPISILEHIGIPPKLVDSLRQLAQQTKRCWVARADTSMEYEKDTAWYEGRTAPTCSSILASTFRGMEAWSQEWLEWWATSQEDG